MKIVLTLTIFYFVIVELCLCAMCPSKVPQVPESIQKFENFQKKKVVLDGVNYGYPLYLNNFFYLQRPVKAIRGTTSIGHKCPSGYRIPSKEELSAMLDSLKGDQTVLTSTDGFNLQEGKIIMTSTKSYPEITGGGNNDAWVFEGLTKKNGKYSIEKVNTFWSEGNIQTFCIVSDVEPSNIIFGNKGVIKNKVTTFKLVDENIKGIVWKINHFLYTTKEISIKFTDNRCYLVEAWYYNLADKLIYSCQPICVDNPYYINKPSSFSLEKVTTIDTGIKSNVVTSIFFSSSNGPISPKLSGGFYLAYTLASDKHLHVLEYNENYEKVNDRDLNIIGNPMDITSTPWGYAILYSEGQALKVTGFFASGAIRFTKIIFDNGSGSKLPKNQIVFTDGSGGAYFGMFNMYAPENGKILFSGGVFGITFAHYNEFNSGQEKSNAHTGDSFITLDENGENEKIAYSWASSHSLVQSILFNGEYFMTSALGDAYPENIKSCLVKPFVLGNTVDKINQRKNNIVSSCADLHPQGLPGSQLGNTCGRMGSIHYNGVKYAIPYTVLPCTGKTKSTSLNEFGLLTYTLDGDKMKNIQKIVIKGISADKIVNIRSGKYGNNILIMYNENGTSFSPKMPPYQGLGFKYSMSYILVDFNGNIVSGPIKSPEHLMDMSNDIRFLENGSLVWSSIVSGGTLKISYLPKLE